MEQKVEKLKEQIKVALKEADEKYTGWDKYHTINMSKIQGMINALEIITDLKYTYKDFE